MKNKLFIITLVLSKLIFAQRPEFTQEEKDYHELLYYTPKSLMTDAIPDSEKRFTNKNLNSIGDFKYLYILGGNKKNTEEYHKWFNSKIELLATELFKEEKRILISKVGGYSGCPKKMIDILLNHIRITNLKFCYTCTGFGTHKQFIKTFNDKMYSLMKIEPPNYRTIDFYGKFIGIDKNKNEIELVLSEDRTFNLKRSTNEDLELTEGLWENKKDTLFLNTTILPKMIA